MMYGRYHKDGEKLKLMLPKARQPIMLTYDEDNVDPKHYRTLINKAVRQRRHVNFKRAHNEAILYFRREPYFKDVHNELHKILAKHKYPLLQGPLVPQLDIAYDSDIEYNKLTFQHDEAQSCMHWSPIMDGLHSLEMIKDLNDTSYEKKDNCTFEIESLQGDKIYGPVCSMEGNLVYTCQFSKCRVACPCTICVYVRNTHDTNNEKRKLTECMNHCQDHKLKLPWTFNAAEDHFTMVASKPNEFHYATPYAGIPLSCQACSNDVIEHQILHLVFHLNCKFCKQEFRPFKNESVLSIADFKQAEIDLINKEDRTCSICLKLCQDKASRKSHQKRTHGQSSCSKCNQTFTSQGKLKYHKTTVHAVTKKETKETLHATDEMHQCNDCGKQFNQNYNLLRHLKEVHNFTNLNLDYAEVDNFVFKCQECNAAFSRNSCLKRHKDTVHNEKKKYTCLKCGKLSTRKDNHNRHIKTCMPDD